MYHYVSLLYNWIRTWMFGGSFTPGIFMTYICKWNDYFETWRLDKKRIFWCNIWVLYLVPGISLEYRSPGIAPGSRILIFHTSAGFLGSWIAQTCSNLPFFCIKRKNIRYLFYTLWLFYPKYILYKKIFWIFWLIKPRKTTYLV